MRNLFPVLLLALALPACGEGGTDPENPNMDEARSDKQRVTSPNVSDQDLATQVAGNSAFAFDLYQELRAQDKGNLFYSPYSISAALAMVHGGARGATETQSEQVMHYRLAQARLHPVFNKIDLELESRGQGKKAADGQPFRLRVANAVWGQRDYHFEQAYLDTIAVNYGAGLRLMDFASQPEPSRKVINQWVEQETESRIKDLIPQGAIDAATRFVLTNAVYFNAAWADQLEEEATRDGAFNLLDGSTVTVPMMSGEIRASYVDAGDYAAAALPYDGHELSMVLIVPRSGRFDAVEATLTGGAIDALVQQLGTAHVRLKLPRFEFETDYTLNRHLEALGMTDAFSAAKADFSGITGNRELYIGLVKHKAFIKVNEQGTEAAAATAVVMPGSAMPEVKELTVDRPFIFLIRDHATGVIVFVGRVVDPS